MHTRGLVDWSTHIHRSVVRKKRRIIALPANARPTNRTESMRDSAGSEAVRRH